MTTNDISTLATAQRDIDLTERWWALESYGADTLYAYGVETDAQTYCDHLNRDLETDLMRHRALGEQQVAKLGLEANLVDVFDLAEELAYLEAEGLLEP